MVWSVTIDYSMTILKFERENQVATIKALFKIIECWEYLSREKKKAGELRDDWTVRDCSL